MATLAAPSIEYANAKAVAPPWHTAALVMLFLVVALSGAFFQRQARTHSGMLQQHPNVVPLYLYAIAMEAGLFVYVWRGGLRRRGIKPSELIGGRWTSARDVLFDVALAVGLWGIWTVVETSWVRWLGPGHAKSIQTLLPRNTMEIVLWIGVSISAGICEEFVFRGYFQKQFEALTHRKWIALILQALLFGISHGYQGIEACLRIAMFGALYGLLALWRKSLRPGMMAHALSDILSGIFGI
jgi:membrane protease YdiL (CAAX protease family)